MTTGTRSRSRTRSGPGATQPVTYPNEQPATLLWYHDHYMGDTRMNVVAGLAGGYLLRDSFDTGSNPLLPGPIGIYELPVVVQDRQFNPDGSLLYPVGPASMHGPWIGEYFGDVMLVNGKIWPKLDRGARGVPVPGAQRLQRTDHGSADLHGRRPRGRADGHHRHRGRAAAGEPGQIRTAW